MCPRGAPAPRRQSLCVLLVYIAINGLSQGRTGPCMYPPPGSVTLGAHVQMEEQRAGKHTNLPDFIFSFFQKRVGIPTAVVEVTQLTATCIHLSHILDWQCSLQFPS
jgi:hypothetical protein